MWVLPTAPMSVPAGSSCAVLLIAFFSLLLPISTSWCSWNGHLSRWYVAEAVVLHKAAGPYPGDRQSVLKEHHLLPFCLRAKVGNNQGRHLTSCSGFPTCALWFTWLHIIIYSHACNSHTHTHTPNQMIKWTEKGIGINYTHIFVQKLSKSLYIHSKEVFYIEMTDNRL